MQKGFFLFLSSLILFPAYAIELKDIKFVQEQEVSRIIFTLDRRGVKAKKFHIPEDKQIILDLKGVKSPAKLLRSIDTSEFSGSVVLISPYRKPDNTNDLRIAIQLRDNVRSSLNAQGNDLILEIENRFGVFSKRRLDNVKLKEQKVGLGAGDRRVNVPRSESVEDILDNLAQSGPKRYVGKRISFNVKDIAVSDLLTMIASASGFNVILSDKVMEKKNVTLSLTNIPWDQALDTVLDLSKLVATKNGNILLVNTLEQATLERQAELDAQTVTLKKEPLVTKVFPISFSKPEDLEKIVKTYLTEGRGTSAVDKRTNYLIVKDTPGNIEKIKKIIETLDTQTPQIQIEAKIVEMDEGYKKELGLKKGVSFGYDPVGEKGVKQSALAGQNTTNGNILQAPQNTGPGFSFSTAPLSGNGGTVAGLVIGQYKRLINLDLSLQLMENQSKGKVISSPKIITQNGKKATIQSEEERPFVKQTFNPGATAADSTVSNDFGSTKSNLVLSVEPVVTNDGSIIMAIELTKDSFAQSAVESLGGPPILFKRKLETNVLVENGSTVVLGGVYQYTKSESHNGIPFLKDIPLIGWLFRSAYNPASSKNELVVFLTPRIVNVEEAGLADRAKIPVE